MFRNKTLLATITFICISGICIAQHINSNVIQPTEASIEQKLASAVWRTDVYICTGIAYAKRNGKTVEDFAEFVGNLHTLGSDLNSVVKTLYYVPTTYPKGKVEILSQTDSSAVIQMNRPWVEYFKDGFFYSTSLQDFESFIFGHLVIMAKRIDLLLNYEYKGEDYVIVTIKNL